MGFWLPILALSVASGIICFSRLMLRSWLSNCFSAACATLLKSSMTANRFFGLRKSKSISLVVSWMVVESFVVSAWRSNFSVTRLSPFSTTSTPSTAASARNNSLKLLLTLKSPCVACAVRGSAESPNACRSEKGRSSAIVAFTPLLFSVPSTTSCPSSRSSLN